MLNEVLTPLFEERQVELRYLAAAVLSYIHSLLQLNIKTQKQVRLLLIKVLLEQGQVDLLYQIFQHRILHDSKVLAQALVEAGQTAGFEKLKQVGIDMMQRLRDHTALVETLTANEFDSEALLYIRKNSLFASLPHMASSIIKKLD